MPHSLFYYSSFTINLFFSLLIMEWLKPKYYYLGLMLLCISYPLLRSFENRLRFYKNWKQLGTSILCMMLIFITWDIVFTQLSIWSFNDNYILGTKLMVYQLKNGCFLFLFLMHVFLSMKFYVIFSLKYPYH